MNVRKVKDYLKSLNDLGAKVTWLGHFAEYRIDPILNIKEIKSIPNQNLRIFESIDLQVKQTLNDISFLDYLSFNDFYKIDQKVLFNNCLIWRDPDHFSSCGEDIIASKADFSLFNQ